MIISLIIYLVCTGIWNIAEYDNKELLFFSSPYWANLDALAVLLSPAAGFYFYELIFGSGPKKIIHRLWKFHLLYAAPYLTMLFLDPTFSHVITYKILSCIYSWWAFKILFFFEGLIIIGVSIERTTEGEASERKVLIIGLAILSITLFFKDLRFANWGIFALIACLMLIIGHRFIVYHGRLKFYSRKLEEKNLILGEWNRNLEQVVAAKTEELRAVLSNLEEQNKDLSYKLTIDPLTQVYNRLKSTQCLESAIMESKETKVNLSIIMFDIDNFKKINDLYGHLVGDQILIQLTKLVSESLRNTDIFARWGGEEFIILLSNTDIDYASRTAERLRTKITSVEFPPVGKISCSFGVTELQPKDYSSECMLKRADTAMYIAKEKGRNQVQISKG